ncbi:MAG: response regulator [Luteolibacter sp.]
MSFISTMPLVAVLDDEANMRIALRRLLHPRGYEVVLFEKGQELLDACTTSEIACIILDLHMPGMNGFEVLEHLAGRNNPPPVIVVTGHDQAGNAERVSLLGCRAYFTKPVDGPPLLETLQQLIRPQGSKGKPQ